MGKIHKTPFPSRIQWTFHVVQLENLIDIIIEILTEKLDIPFPWSVLLHARSLTYFFCLYLTPRIHWIEMIFL